VWYKGSVRVRRENIESTASLKAMLITLLLSLTVSGLYPSTQALASTDDSQDEGVFCDVIDTTTGADVFRRDPDTVAAELLLFSSIEIPSTFYVDVPNLSLVLVSRDRFLLLIQAPKTSPPALPC